MCLLEARQRKNRGAIYSGAPVQSRCSIAWGRDLGLPPAFPNQVGRSSSSQPSSNSISILISKKIMMMILH